MNYKVDFTYSSAKKKDMCPIRGDLDLLTLSTPTSIPLRSSQICRTSIHVETVLATGLQLRVCGEERMKATRNSLGNDTQQEKARDSA